MGNITKTSQYIEFQCVNCTGHEWGGKSGCTLCGSLCSHFTRMTVDLFPHLSVCSSSTVCPSWPSHSAAGRQTHTLCDEPAHFQAKVVCQRLISYHWRIYLLEAVPPSDLIPVWSGRVVSVYLIFFCKGYLEQHFPIVRRTILKNIVIHFVLSSNVFRKYV